MPMFGYVNPLRGEPLTGEPDAGEPPVRFGGRGNETNRLFLPLYRREFRSIILRQWWSLIINDVVDRSGQGFLRPQAYSTTAV